MRAAIRSCTRQKPGKQMFCFSFPLDQRAAGKGVSKTGIKERIHQAGRWALFWGRGGRRRPPCWLRQMQAPGEEARGLLRFSNPGRSGGLGRGQPTPGQKFSGTAVSTRVCARTWPGPPVGLHPRALLSADSFFFFLVCPHRRPLKWPPCQPSAVQNFHAASKVGFSPCCFACGFLLSALGNLRGAGLSSPAPTALRLGEGLFVPGTFKNKCLFHMACPAGRKGCFPQSGRCM